MYLVVAVGGRRYAIDTSAVQEVLRRPPQAEVPSSEEAIAGVMFFRGRCLTVIDMGWRLMERHVPLSNSARVVVLRVPQAAALLVEGISGLTTNALEDPSEPFHPVGRESRYVVGRVRWNDRTLSVVDSSKLVSPETRETTLRTGVCAVVRSAGPPGP